MLEREDIKWKQQAKQNWYQNGDQNTIFFFFFFFFMHGQMIGRKSIVLGKLGMMKGERGRSQRTSLFIK
jgi:hypothetical protein